MCPSRGAKGYTIKKGIHCPCIIQYPPLLKTTGLSNDMFTTIVDILRTVLELAGIQHSVGDPGSNCSQLMTTPASRSIPIRL